MTPISDSAWPTVIVWALLMFAAVAALWDIGRSQKWDWFVRTAIVLASIVLLAWLSHWLLLELWREYP